jgi:hypothetical protein
VLDPRLNIVQRLTDSITMRQGIGRYHQPPTPADVDPSSGNPRLKSSYTDQLSLGIDDQMSETTFASLTGYYERGSNIGVWVPHGAQQSQYEPDFGGLGPTFLLLLEKQLGYSYYRENLGRARTYGLELLIKHSAGPWFTMLGYTLSRSERSEPPQYFPYTWRPFDLDQTHDLNAAASYGVGNWRFGARIQLVSGNPYTPATPGDFGPIRHPWAGTLPWFFQLDLRADHRWRRCWGDVNLYIDVENVTDYTNVEGRDYSQVFRMDRDIEGLPTVPFIGVEFIPK